MRSGRRQARLALAVGALGSLGLIACGLLAETDPRAPELPPATAVEAGSRDALPEAHADAPADVTSDAAPAPQCAALGGQCVVGRWAQCPPGTQPTEDIHADCLPASATRGYFCCVPAPPSPCADGETGDCFANGCEACWSPADQTPSTCAGGRTCCAYTCPD